MPVRCHPCPRTPVTYVPGPYSSHARRNDRTRLARGEEMPPHGVNLFAGHHIRFPPRVRRVRGEILALIKLRVHLRRAAVIADGECHRHRAGGAGQGAAYSVG
jgi:hypothetical protein